MSQCLRRSRYWRNRSGELRLSVPITGSLEKLSPPAELQPVPNAVPKLSTPRSTRIKLRELSSLLSLVGTVLESTPSRIRTRGLPDQAEVPRLGALPITGPTPCLGFLRGEPPSFRTVDIQGPTKLYCLVNMEAIGHGQHRRCGDHPTNVRCPTDHGPLAGQHTRVIQERTKLVAGFLGQFGNHRQRRKRCSCNSMGAVRSVTTPGMDLPAHLQARQSLGFRGRGFHERETWIYLCFKRVPAIEQPICCTRARTEQNSFPAGLLGSGDAKTRRCGKGRHC